MPVRCLCLAGPTASGKSRAALAIARELGDEGCGVEIISVDSAQVYRGMDIGTAKPTPDERAAVTHHLIDIVDPSDAYSAARFAGDAARLIDAIGERGRVPLLVGGTMLYFKALFDGLDALPSADAAIRAEIAGFAARAGWPAVHAELAKVDPQTAARLPPNDAQRLQRALEVWRLTGKPLSQLHGSGALPPLAPSQRPVVSLEPADRAWLHERIGERFRAMLQAGFIDEVKALRARGDLHVGLPSMRCVGYRQVWQGLDEGLPTAVIEARGIAATRQLAKRQLTWLRGMAAREVVACDAADTAAEVVAWARRRMHDA